MKIIMKTVLFREKKLVHVQYVSNVFLKDFYYFYLYLYIMYVSVWIHAMYVHDQEDQKGTSGL